MRKLYPRIYDKRIKRVFLIFPKMLPIERRIYIEAARERRWLEVAYILQEYYKSPSGNYWWSDICWAKGTRQDD